MKAENSTVLVHANEIGQSELTPEIAIIRYQNLIAKNGNGEIYQAIRNSTPVLSEYGLKFRRMMGQFVLSPLFLVSSLIVMLFFPDNVVRKIMAPFSNLRFWERAGKRLFDLVGAIFGFIGSSIFFFIIPVLVRLDSKGPVFYKQKRVGLNHRYQDRRKVRLAVANERRKSERRREDLYGRPFMVYKFRTMYADAEKRSGAVWAQKDDPRITPVGRILRFTHIDEIPQFFNVLCGEMSMVGPRPERPQIIPNLVKEIPGYPQRLQVKPGITGIAQIVCGYDVTLESVREKLMYDMKYVKNNSLKTDIAILLQTLWVILRGKEVLEQK